MSEILDALKKVGLSMSKTDGEPPEYEFGLEGYSKMIRVPLGMVHHRAKVNLTMWGAWDIGPLRHISDKEWSDVVDEWIGSGTVSIIETGGTDLPSRIIMAVKQWLDARGEGTEYSDLQSGCYVRRVNGGEECLCFLPDPLFKNASRWLGHPVKAQDIEFALRKVGLRTGREVNPIRVGNPGCQFRPWVIPVERLNGVEFEPEDKQAQLPETEEVTAEF
jgi:hypothetical protein